ncbi:MAG: aminotransferase class IV [Ferruginibacter sp.]
MPYINYNGKTVAADQAVVAAASRGLRYGDGLFETMKMLNGSIINETAHFDRLWHGMGVLQFDIRAHFNREHLAGIIKLLAQKNGHEAAARIRLNIFRGEGGLYDPVNHLPNYIIETWPLENAAPGLNTNGLVAGVFYDVKKSCDILSNLKHNNYLHFALAALKAKKEQWNDAFILNQHGRIAESTISNIFIIKNETVYTPALTEGCVAGTMRKLLIQFLQQNGWAVNETAISIDDVAEAREIFLTNSTSVIRWVGRVGDSNYKNTLTQKIYKAFLPTIC